MKKPLKHAYLTLLDISEALPFGIKPQPPMEKLTDIDSAADLEKKSDEELQAFVELLEKNYREQLCYIGTDIIGEKFYKRFLFENGGFCEIVTGVPVVISAHFTKMNRAVKFSDALKKTIQKVVPERKIQEILFNSIEIDEELAKILTFEKWEKLRSIREGV